MRLRSTFAVALAAALLGLPADLAAAESTHRLGRFGEWESYSYGDGTAKTCYTATAAIRLQGADKGKVNAFLTVTHRPGTKSVDVVSVNAGFGFKTGSEVELQVGAKPSTLFTKGDNAWTKDAAADTAIVAALRKGKEVTMHATAAKGGAVTAAFSLAGFADALAAADKACGLKR